MSFLENPDFKDLPAALEKTGVQYLVVGGHAGGFHARPRATKDLDLWIGEHPENRRRMGEALQAFRAPQTICHHLERAGPDDIVWFGRAPNRVDILQRLISVEFDQALSRAVRARADELSVLVISMEDLIANKRAAGRDQDLRDVRAPERCPSCARTASIEWPEVTA
ncbi:MAG: hypothetical protein WCF10_00780 [Polyangiales bacterium]